METNAGAAMKWKPTSSTRAALVWALTSNKIGARKCNLATKGRQAKKWNPTSKATAAKKNWNPSSLVTGVKKMKDPHSKVTAAKKLWNPTFGNILKILIKISRNSTLSRKSLKPPSVAYRANCKYNKVRRNKWRRTSVAV